MLSKPSKLKLHFRLNCRMLKRMHFGIGEIIFLAIVLTLIFSASRMSALGNALGKFIHAFRKASSGDNFIDLPAQTTSHAEEQAASVKTKPQTPNSF